MSSDPQTTGGKQNSPVAAAYWTTKHYFPKHNATNRYSKEIINSMSLSKTVSCTKRGPPSVLVSAYLCLSRASALILACSTTASWRKGTRRAMDTCHAFPRSFESLFGNIMLSLSCVFRVYVCVCVCVCVCVYIHTHTQINIHTPS